LVVVGVSWLASPRPSESRLAAPAAASVGGAAVASAPVPVPAEPTAAPTPIPAPAVTPEPQPAVQRLRVSGTNGSGVNLRSKPGERSQRIKTVPEGTTLEIVGETQVADGLQWRNVREPGGGIGWIAASFASPIQ
jgi:SH3-like domain-containing protein